MANTQIYTTCFLALYIHINMYHNIDNTVRLEVWLMVGAANGMLLCREYQACDVHLLLSIPLSIANASALLLRR